MENLAHTLLGLSLAKAGFERVSPLAATALVVSSNLPDIDVVTGLVGGTASYLRYHRGVTHSFTGLVALAAALTFVLVLFDRRFRLRRHAFERPARPARLFAISCLGGLGHLFMDYTNSYGARPLLPFDSRWFYGDLAFVLDPWIWLILGATVVWLTAKGPARVMFWVVIGVLTSLVMALGARRPTGPYLISVPSTVRIVWFVGLAIVILGAMLGFRRGGEKLARYSLFILTIYYGTLSLAHQEAMDRAKRLLPNEGAVLAAAWPAPANPLVWQAVATGNGVIYTRHIDILDVKDGWREESLLDARFIEALRSSPQASVFLSFSRLAAAVVEETDDGYSIMLRDIRFDLRMKASLDRDLNVHSVEVRWY